MPLAPGRISQRPAGEIMESFEVDAAVEDAVKRTRLRKEVKVLRSILVGCGA